MKRILMLLLTVVLAFSLFACSKPKSRTAQFYESIDKTSFWYKGEVIKGGKSYVYTQAVDSDSCTTIEDHAKDSDDGYVIYDGTHLHQLNIKARRYDTVKTADGVSFLFGENDFKDFNKPKSVFESAYFEQVSYYCEVFSVVDEKGNEIGENKYYFDNDRLVAIQWYENGNLSATMKMTEYSNQIPEDIYTSVPSDFKAGTYTAEQVVDPWADKSE